MPQRSFIIICSFCYLRLTIKFLFLHKIINLFASFFIRKVFFAISLGSHHIVCIPFFLLPWLLLSLNFNILIKLLFSSQLFFLLIFFLFLFPFLICFHLFGELLSICFHFLLFGFLNLRISIIKKSPSQISCMIFLLI